MPEAPVLPLSFLVEIDGRECPLDISAVTARHAGELAMFFLTDVRELQAALVNQRVTEREAAAIWFLSWRQLGREVDPDVVLDSVTVGSRVTVTFEVPEDLEGLGLDVAAAMDPSADPES